MSNTKTVEPIEPVEVEAEVVGVPTFQSDKPTNAELVAHAANALDAVSMTAESLGADGVAEVTREAGKVARAVPKAIEGVKREIEPAKVAIGGFWKALERRGVVGTKAPINIAALQKRGMGGGSRP